MLYGLVSDTKLYWNFDIVTESILTESIRTLAFD